MRKKKLKNKKRIIILVIIVLLLILTTIISITTIIKNNKTIETSKEINDNFDEEISEEILEVQVEEYNNETNLVIDNTKDDSQTNNIVENNGTSKLNQNTSTNNNSTYYIKVNNLANVVTIYSKDENGNYTVPVKAMVCSTGTATPQSGKYKIPGGKGRWGKLFGHTPGTYVYGQYTTAIVGNILFHSVPYTRSGDPASLEYWEYDKLGTRASAGCVRLTVQDAQWIYNNISRGTTVEFYSDSNPGPLGKPSAQKISSNTTCRNWDPTDSNQANPWRSNNKTQEPVIENVQEPAKNEVDNSSTKENTISSSGQNNNETNSSIENNNVANNFIEKDEIVDNTTINNTTINNEVENNIIN